MSSTDLEYFQERAVAERAMAAAATESRTIAAHLELARGYDALVRKEEPSRARPSAVRPAPAPHEQREELRRPASGSA